MKRLLLIILTLSFTVLPLAAESPWNIYMEMDMYRGFKTGIKYHLNENFDFISSFGLNITAQEQYCYSTYVAYHTLTNYDKIKVDVNFGFIQGMFDNTSAEEDRYFLINPGVTMHVAYPIVDGIYVGAQGGMVLMIGYENNTWATSLEPYVGITFSISEDVLFQK